MPHGLAAKRSPTPAGGACASEFWQVRSDDENKDEVATMSNMQALGLKSDSTQARCKFELETEANVKLTAQGHNLPQVIDHGDVFSTAPNRVLAEKSKIDFRLACHDGFQLSPIEQIQQGGGNE
jgi:hypothetical protein